MLRICRWIPTVWLGFIAARYGLTVISAIRHPFSEGWDIAWTAAWLLALLAAILLKRIWWHIVVGLAGIILVFSHALVPAVTALVVIAVAIGLGQFAMDRLALTENAFLERIPVAASIGIGFLALGQFTIAALHFFNSLSSWCFVLICAAPAFFGIRRLSMVPLKSVPGEHSQLFRPMGYVFLLNLMWAATPEIQFDPLNVHLAVPRLYLHSGGMIDLPYFFHSYFAHLLDMVFGLCLALGGPLVAKFLVLDLGLLAAVAVFIIGKALFNSEVGVWASLIFYSTPVVLWLSSTTYLDLPMTLFIMASVICFIRWQERSHWGWLAASGWIAGVAAGTKIAALTILIIFPIVGIARAWRDRSAALVPCIAAYAIPLAVVAIPWYLAIYIHTGNPVFPFLNAVFQSPQWPIENTSLNAQDFGIGTSAGALVRLPFRLTFNSTAFGEALPRGGVGIALLLAFPLCLVFIGRWTILQRTVLAAVGVYLAVWVLTFQYGRYYVPALPFLAVMGCAVFLLESPTRALTWNRLLLSFCVISQVPVASVMFWNLPERFPIYRAFGLETEQAFLARTLPAYEAAHFLNTVSRPEEKVIGVGVENMRFYLNAPLFLKTEIDLDRPPYEFAKFETAPELAEGLIDEGFAYLFVLRTELGHSDTTYPYLRPLFLEQFAEEIYGDRNAVVFRISLRRTTR